MKKLILLALILGLSACGGSDGTDTLLTPHQLDSLVNKNPDKLPVADWDNVTDTAPTPEVVEEAGNKYLRILLPRVDNSPSLGHVVVDVYFKADTISSYNIKAESAKSASSTEYKTPQRIDPGKIQPDDTKIKIGRRLGVSPSNIGNKEPLQVGEVIIIK